VSDYYTRFERRKRLRSIFAGISVSLVLIAGSIFLRQRFGQPITVSEATPNPTTPVPTREPTDSPTPEPSDTPIPPTETGTPEPTATLESDAAVEGTATRTPWPTVAWTPDPDLLPTAIPTLKIYNTGGFAPPDRIPPTAIPDPAAEVPIPAGVINVLLLGSDHRIGSIGNTDVMIIVSINMQEGTVNMLSLPRDMLVYIPGYTMAKLNQAYAHGEQVGWSNGGFGLLQETLLYNFGIYVGHYVLIDLNGFQDAVDVLGTIEVAVDCKMEGYVLKEPRLRQDDFETYDEWVEYTDPESGNWEWLSLPVGVHEMDGYLALWYARYRSGTSDFDRAYRQHQVLRAIVDQARDDGLLNLARIPQLWVEYNSLVKTSMDVGNLIQFAPIAADLDEIGVRSFVLTSDYLTGWDDPQTEQNDYYLVPNPEAIRALMFEAMQPPTRNYITANTITVEVRNGTATERLDEVAASRLLWYGVRATAAGTADTTLYDKTTIYDLTGNPRNSQLRIMQTALRVDSDHVIIQLDPNRTYDYIVILGQDYKSCERNPQVISTATVTPEPAVEPTAEPETLAE